MLTQLIPAYKHNVIFKITKRYETKKAYVIICVKYIGTRVRVTLGNVSKQQGYTTYVCIVPL